MYGTQDAKRGTVGGSNLNLVEKEYAEAATQPAEREPMVPDKIELLERGIVFQQELVRMLGNRLSPAMSLDPPSGGPAAAANEPTCPLAATILSFARRVEEHNALLQSFLRRLEL